MEGKEFFKQKTNRIGQKLIAMIILVAMFMVDLAPLSTVNANSIKYNGSWTNLSSSSYDLLKNIGNSISQKVVTYLNNSSGVILSQEQVAKINEPQKASDNKFHIEIPNDFLNNFNGYGSVNSFDFSGIYLGGSYSLPNFSVFKNLKEVKFNGCSISNLAPFQSAYNNEYFKYIERIELNGLSAGLKNKTNDQYIFLSGKVSSHSFQPGNTYDPTTNLPTVYTITYDANGGTGAPKAQQKEKGKTIKLRSEKPTKTGYTFVQWIVIVADKTYSYQPGADFPWDRDMTLIAQWRSNSTGKTEDIESGGSYTYEYTTTTTTYYTETWHEMEFWGESSVPEINNPSKTKEIKLIAHVSGTVVINNVAMPASASDCIMKVNGNRIDNVNGVGTFIATKNGSYNVEIRYPTYGEDGAYKHTWEIDNIDNTKPSFDVTQNYPNKTVQEGGATGKTVNITAHDNFELKSIKIGNQTRKVSGTDSTVSFTITQTGNYDITVIDAAGNEYTRTEKIVVDDQAPVVVNTIVENMNGTPNPSVDSVAVNHKERIRIVLTCNDNDDKGIRSVGAVGNTAKGTIQLSNGKGANPQISEEAILSRKIDGNKIEFILDGTRIIDDIEPGEWNVIVNGISDYSNNYIEQYTLPIKLVVDNTPPEISSFEIKGGTRSVDGKAVMIVPGEKLTFNLTVTEELGSKPVINILDKPFNMEFSSTILRNGVRHYIYTATIESSELASAEDGVVDIKLTNIVDYAGNVIDGEEVTYNDKHKTTNVVYLYKGIYQVESLYIVGTNISGNVVMGDLNDDGYITLFDIIEAQKYSVGIKEITPDILKRADCNGDGTVTLEDCLYLYRKLDNTKNTFVPENTGNSFKVCDQDGNIVDSDEIIWTILDKDNNEINNNNIIPTIDEDGTLKLQINTEEYRTIRIKASKRNGEYGTITLYDGKGYVNAGIRVDGENQTGHSIVGDVNGDGYVTSYDAYCVLAGSVGYGDENWQGKLADWNGDGQADASDAVLLLRKDLNLGANGFHCIEKGDSLRLVEAYLRTNGQMVEDLTNIHWDNPVILEGNQGAFEIVQNDDGSATLTANGNPGDKAYIMVTGEAENVADDENKTKTSIIYFEIVDLDISLNKYEIEYDLSKNEEHEILFATVNMENKKVDVESKDENIAKIQIDEYGRVEVIPVGVGRTTIDFTCEDKTVSCEVNVKKSITTITAPENVTVKEGDTEEIEIKNDGEGEELLFEVEDDKIAKITYNEETGKYVIHGISEGTTTIKAYSPSNPGIIRNINVTVEKVTAPRLVEVSATEGYFKAGDEIRLFFTFDSEVQGTRPDLQLSFGNYQSKNTPNYLVSEDLKTITYSYIVAEGDNGPLVINKLGKGLKDITGKYDAIVTYDNDKYNNQGVYDDSQDNGQSIEKGEYVNDGIYTEMINTVADTEKPVIELETGSFSHWLKNGDTIEVMLVCRNDVLKDNLKVYFNRIEANVERQGTSNTVFKASLEVTDEIEEGYLEIVVDNYEDLAGNVGDRLVAKEDNIDKSIIIDRTAPDINVNVITPKAEGEKYEAGDEVTIEVYFVDKTRETEEYIIADNAPAMNLTFGGKAIKGVLTNDYQTGDNKEPVSKITYTYKIAEGDVGDLRLQSIVGKVEDVTGNEADINKVYDGGYYILTKDAENNNDNKETYTVTYDANGGENAPEAQTKEKGKDLTLSTSIPSRTGYVFKGWATSKTATEINYEFGAKYTNDENITLYAVWQESKNDEDNNNNDDKTKEDEKDNNNTDDKTNTDNKDTSSKDNSNTNKDTTQNSSNSGTTKAYNGSLPYTGAQTAGMVMGGLVVFGLGIAIYFTNKKRKM